MYLIMPALAVAAFVAIGLAMGHLLGGPNEDERTVLALATRRYHRRTKVPSTAGGSAGTVVLR